MTTQETFIQIAQNANSPFLHDMDIIDETEKAYKLQNLYGVSCWIPKKALVQIKDLPFEAYSFATWFRKIDQGRAIDRAFRLF